MQQLRQVFKRTINRNKYHSKTTTQNTPNPYLDFLIHASFQGVNRLFVLPFNANDSRIGHLKCYLPTAKVKDYNFMIDGKIFFDQTIKSYIKTYENVQKITDDQEDDYITGCLLDYNCFIKHYKMIAIDLSKPQAFDANPKTIQQFNFTRNLSGANNRVMSFIIEEFQENILDFSQGTLKILWMLSY